MFATHFKEIAMAFEGRSGFVNLHLHTEEHSNPRKLTVGEE
jgi:hypothetical protein